MPIIYYVFINLASCAAGITLSSFSFWLISKLEVFLYNITDMPIMETLSTIPILALITGLYVIFTIVFPWTVSTLINGLAAGLQIGAILTSAAIGILWIAITAFAIIYSYPIGKVIIYILMVIATIVQFLQTIKGDY